MNDDLTPQEQAYLRRRLDALQKQDRIINWVALRIGLPVLMFALAVIWWRLTSELWP